MNTNGMLVMSPPNLAQTSNQLNAQNTQAAGKQKQGCGWSARLKSACCKFWRFQNGLNQAFLFEIRDCKCASSEKITLKCSYLKHKVLQRVERGYKLLGWSRSQSYCACVFQRICVAFTCCTIDLVSSKISDLCEISHLFLFVSYFASQSKGIKLGDYFFDVGCVNQNFLVRRQIPRASCSMGITITVEKYWTYS